MDDRVCNLQCIKDGTLHEFVGPVKIILIDPPPSLYTERRAIAALIAIANMLMGACVMTVIIYTMRLGHDFYENFHIAICTIGSQLFVPSGILMIHDLNGASYPLKVQDRRRQHFFLMLFGVLSTSVGGALRFFCGKTVIKPEEEWYTQKEMIHYYCAYGLAGLAGLSCFVGLFVYCFKCYSACIAHTHRFLGILTVTASAVSFITGIFKLDDLSHHRFIFLIIFCVFFSVVVVISPVQKLIMPKSDEDAASMPAK